MPAPSRAAAAARLRLDADPGVRLAFTSRAEGSISLVVGDGCTRADIASSRAGLAGAVGLEAADLVFMEQVHGPAVAVVGLSDAGRGLTDHARAVPGVDALVTTDPDVGLVVMVADCVPVLLAVAGRGVAAVHAGRAGVTAGVVGAAVAILAAEAGAEPRAVLAVIGPAVGPCCYEVPADLRREVVVAAPAAGGTTSWGTPSLDLPAAVVQQLVAAGAGAVRDIGGCTRCDTTWFSHRATTAPPPGERPAPAGRQAGVIRMGAPPALLTDVHSLGFPV